MNHPLFYVVAAVRKLWPLIVQVAAEKDVPAALIAAVIARESEGNPHALNAASGATGLMQILPKESIKHYPAAAWLLKRPSREALYDPLFNLRYGTQLLIDFGVERNEYVALQNYSGMAAWPERFEEIYWPVVQAYRTAFEEMEQMTNPTIINKPTPNQWPRPAGKKVGYIVIHSPEGNGDLDDTVDYMLKHPTGAAYHEVVGLDRVFVMADYANWTGHATYGTLPNGATGREVDYQSYSISLNNKAGQRPIEEAIRNGAIRAAVALKHFGLGVDRVVSHGQIDPRRRSDPTGVKMKDFRNLVEHYMSEPQMLNQGWTRDDARIVAWFAEQLARALRGDVGEMEAYIGALRAELPSEGKHNVLVSVALPELYKARDN